MKRAKRFLAPVAVVLIAGLCFSGCDSGPTEPIVPPKTAEQLAQEAIDEARKVACAQTGIEATFRQGGHAVTRWSSKDDVVVRGLPYNRDGAAVPANCDPPFSRIASWTLLVGPGLSCVPFGPVRSLVFDINCEGDGITVALVTHVSLGKVFTAETVGLVSSVGVKSHAPSGFSEAEIRELLMTFRARDAGGLREPTPHELGLAARALRGNW